MQLLQQDERHQVLGWRVETTAICCNALYVTCEETCFRMAADEWLEVAELQSTHEERRSRHPFAFAYIACSKNWFECSHTHNRIHRSHCALSCFPKKYVPCPINQKGGTQNHTRFVEISKLAWSLGDIVCDNLIGLHAFTGYDTVSAFASRGKLSALKLMKKGITYQGTFSQIGQSCDVQPQLSEKVQPFTCRMYVAASSTTEVNDLRYKLFCVKRGEIGSIMLPPCIYCLFIHLLRANYQAAIWKCCLHACPTKPDPTK